MISTIDDYYEALPDVWSSSTLYLKNRSSWFQTITLVILETELYPIVFKVTAVFLKCTFGLYFRIERLSRLRDFGVDEKLLAEFKVELPITCEFKVCLLPFSHKLDANLCERLSCCTSLALTVKRFDKR